ncbi:NAD kinase-like isoform X1 [Amphibalanus amphitrite]|nr:NAD kinase-like isoform X1 [Amphibalanus amphitrite]XP_043237384.1 NAD kinase-like isoform X1 [Amphibalanus amphitrite]
MNEREIQLAHALIKAETDGGSHKKAHKTHASRLQEKIEKGMSVRQVELSEHGQNGAVTTSTTAPGAVIGGPAAATVTGPAVPTVPPAANGCVCVCGGGDNCEQQRRTRSLNAPSPIQQFGPCGRIMKNSAMVMTIQDPASQRLTWYKAPMAVLVIKKVRDASVLAPFIQLVSWLTNEKKMIVFVEHSVLDDPLLAGAPAWASLESKVQTFTDGKDDLTDKIDFIVCLGGDGTLLYASSLFQQSVPPVMAFHLGSLGFLTPFKFDNFQEQVNAVLEGHAALTLRSRLRCIVLRKDSDTKQKPPTNLLVLNEVVVDRGPSPYLSNIDLYLDGKKITSVQGDGLIVSTPTGSTAYAVAAGASMIHPSVPAIMVTPICPHSLSFRPIVVPAGVELKIAVSPDSRNTAWVSFDGRSRQELKHGDSLRVTTSIYPIPSICASDQIADWFESLDECLRWNDRKKQRQFDPADIADGFVAPHKMEETSD